MPSNQINILVNVKKAGDAELSAISAGLKNLDVAVRGTMASFKGLAGSLTAFTAAAAGLGLTLRNIVSTFAQFDDTMRAVGAISGANEAQYKRMTEVAKEMGEQTRYTAQQAADGLRFLSMAGLSAAEATKALPNVLQLAASANMDLGRAADITTNIMTGYGKAAKDLNDINDTLVKTFTRSNTNLEELGTAFSYVGPIAKELGIRFNETSAALGLLANAGLKGEKGGTALRNILSILVAPTSNMSKLMDKLGVDTQELGVDLGDSASALRSLGIEIKNSSGNMKPLREILKELQDRLQQFPNAADRTGIIMEIFGKRAGPAMAALLSQGSDALEKLLGEIDNAGGTAQKTADQMEAGLGGAIRSLNSAIEGLVITVGDDLDSVLRPLIKLLVDWIRFINETDDATRILIEAIAALTAGMVIYELALKRIAGLTAALVVQPLLSYFQGVATAVQTATASVAASGIALNAASIGVAAFSAAAALAIPAILALGYAYWELSKAIEQVEQAQADLEKVQNTVGKASDKQAREIGERLGVGIDNMKGLFALVDKGEIVWSDITNRWENATRVLNKQTGEIELTGKEMKKLESEVKNIGQTYSDTRAQISDSFDVAAQKAQLLANSEEEANKRIIAIGREKMAALIDLARQEADQKRALIAGSGASAQQQAALEKQINKDMIDSKIAALKKYRDQLMSSMQTAIAEEKKYAAEVLRLQKEISASRMSYDEKVRELKRKFLSEEQQWIDKQKQAYDTLGQAQLAFAQAKTPEELSRAADLAKKAMEQAEAIATEVKQGEQVVVSLGKGVGEAMKIMQPAEQILEQSLQKQAELIQKNQEGARQQGQVYSEEIGKVSTEIDRLNQQKIDITATVRVDSSAVDAKLRELDGMVTHSTHVIHVQKVEESATGGIIGMAEGGWNRLRGKLSGYGGGDRIRALLEAGEFVVRKEAVAKYGAGLFHALNAMRINAAEMFAGALSSVPKLASGGHVQNYGTLQLQAGGVSLPVQVSGPRGREMVREFEAALRKERLVKGR